jgi:hypothetical protein
MSIGTQIFNYIDSPRKYAGFTFIEISVVGSIGFIGFLTDHMVFGIVGSFFGLYITKYLADLASTYFAHRFIFFYLSDFFVPSSSNVEQINIFAKFYI